MTGVIDLLLGGTQLMPPSRMKHVQNTNLYKPVSDWLEMLPHRTTVLNNIKVFSVGHK